MKGTRMSWILRAEICGIRPLEHSSQDDRHATSEVLFSEILLARWGRNANMHRSATVSECRDGYLPLYYCFEDGGALTAQVGITRSSLLA